VRDWKIWIPAVVLILYGIYSFCACSIFIPGRGPRVPAVGVVLNALPGHTFIGAKARGMSLALVAFGAGLIGMAEGSRQTREAWFVTGIGLAGFSLLGFLFSLIALAG
jgi:hypothetical protein